MFESIHERQPRSDSVECVRGERGSWKFSETDAARFNLKHIVGNSNNKQSFSAIVKGVRLSQRILDDLSRMAKKQTNVSASFEDPRDAAEIARQRGHVELVPELQAEPAEGDLPFPVLDGHLMGLIEARVRPALTVRLRYPQTAVVHEAGRVWYPVPGMYGGFLLKAIPEGVEAESWVRVVGGSGQRHVISRNGCQLVEEGFV